VEQQGPQAGTSLEPAIYELQGRGVKLSRGERVAGWRQRVGAWWPSGWRRKSRSGPILATHRSFSQNAILLKRINLFLAVQSRLQKYFRSLLTQISSEIAPSRPLQGRIEIVTNAGRDAMDADGAADELH
jgi:hypothetical protein